MSQNPPPILLSREDHELVAWLDSHGIRLRWFRHPSGQVVYESRSVDLAKLRAGLAELTVPYQAHIDADHAALRRVWELHHSGQGYCPEDGFAEPCRTRRAITGEDGEPPHLPAEPVVIEVPGQPWTATCPQCGMTRSLPDEWQDLLRASMPKDEADTWDGVLRCQNDHEPVGMDITVSESQRVATPGYGVLLTSQEVPEISEEMRQVAREMGMPSRQEWSNAMESGNPQAVADFIHEHVHELLIDPDCRDGKHGSCVGGICECECHGQARDG